MKTAILLLTLLSIDFISYAQTLQVGNETLNRKKYTQTDLPAFDSPVQGNVPEYRYYYEFGDGRYLKTDKSGIAYGYDNGGTYDVLYKSIRIYDEGDDPDELMRESGIIANQYIRQSNLRTVIPYSKMKQDILDINIDVSTNQIKGNDENVIILSVKKPNNSSTINGSLYLFYNKKNIARVSDDPKGNVERNNEIPTIQFETYSFDGSNNRTYSNPNISFNRNGNTNILTGLGSFNNLKSRFNNFFKFEINNLSNSNQQNVFINLSAKNNLPINSQLEIIGLLIDDNSPSNNKRRKLNLTYGKAYDPNNLIVDPTCVSCKKLSSTVLNYRVNFQNNGSGSANNIGVKIILPNGIDQNTFSRNFVNATNFNLAYSIVDNTSTPGELMFDISGASLQGYFEDDTENYNETTGYIDFSFPLSNTISCSESLKAQAFIVFDGQPPIETNVAEVEFSKVIGFKSKSIKLGSDYSLSKNEIGGFIGLAMKADCRKEWYNQFELMAGYSRYKCDLDSVFSSCHLYSEDVDNTDLKIYELSSHNINLAIVPIHLRNDINQIISAGVGVELRTLLKFGELYSTEQRLPYDEVLFNFDSSLFADVNFNLGRLTLGGRYLYGIELALSNNELSSYFNTKNRIQGYLQLKL